MWDLIDSTARLCRDDISCSIQLEQPQRGLHDLTVLGRELSCERLLGIVTPLAVDNDRPLDDAFVRGADLIATYSRSVAGAVRPQIYWRAGEILNGDAHCFFVELIVSVETNLLDSDPSVDVVTDLSCEGIWRLGNLNYGEFEAVDDPRIDEFRLAESDDANVVLFRPVDASVSYVEVVPRADFQAGSLKRSGSSTSWSCRLFNERLEKGVIRRGRVWGIFVPRADDLNLARRCCSQIQRVAPPLTA